jgi:hypothetical protein
MDQHPNFYGFYENFLPRTTHLHTFSYEEVAQNVMEMVSYKGEDKYTFKEKFYNLELTSTKPKLTEVEAEETEIEKTSGF